MRYRPSRLTRRTRRHSLKVSSSHFTNGTIAALFTSTSSLPYWEATAWNSFATASSSPMSHACPKLLPPIALAVALAPSPLMSTATTTAPSWPSRSATARPMPCAAPDTTATRPSNLRMLSPMIGNSALDDLQRGVDPRRDLDLAPQPAQRAAQRGQRDGGIDRLRHRAHVADADQLALGLVAAGREHDAELEARRLEQLLVVDTGRHAHGGAGGRGDALGLGPQLEAHGLDAGAAGARGEGVAAPDILRPFTQILVERAVEAVHFRDRRREGEVFLLAPRFLPVLEAEDGSERRLGIGLDMLPGAVADRHDGEARRAAQALAGAGDEDVGEAIVGVDIHAAERRDGIDDQQSVMLAHDLADLARAIDGARRRVVVDQRHHLDVRPLAEGVRDLAGIDRLVVRDLDLHHVLVVARRPVAEALAVDAGGKVQHGVVGRDQGSGGGLDPGRRLDLQDQRRILGAQRGGAFAGHVLVELLEPWVEVVLHRARHGAQDARIGRDWSRGQGDDRFLDL